MRFLLTLRRLSDPAIIPINYQYELSAWIYRVLAEGDAAFSDWLHREGYRIEGKQFKLFTFSGLDIPRFRRQEDRLEVISREVGLQVSFCLAPSASHFLSGLFRAQRFGLGDRLSRADFEVLRVELLPAPAMGDVAHFRSLSPVCIATARNEGGRRKAKYHSPEEAGYGPLLFANLLDKYHAARQVLRDDPDTGAFDEKTMGFRLLSAPQSRLVTLAAHTPRQTQVRGFLFDFEMKAPPELLQFAYEAGVGEKNSMGFGCVGMIEGLSD